MQFNYEDYKKFNNGLMDQPEAERFLEWLDTPEGEATFHKWVGEEWDLYPSENNFYYDVQNKQPKFFTAAFFRNSAATMFIATTTVLIFYLNINSEPPIEYQTIKQPTQIVKSASKGKKNNISLSDGSKVHLNSESSISYLSNFNEERTIYLTGEAFFEVATDSIRPFTVITQDISTVALGTQFNINAYPEKKEVLVSLISGKVFVDSKTSNKETLYLQPGEGVGYGLKTKTLKKKKIDIEKIIQWKSGIIQFDEVPFEDVIHTLERWYGVNIYWDEAIKIPDLKCTGKFKPNEYLTNVLQALSHSIEFEYTIDNKEVSLKF